MNEERGFTLLEVLFAVAIFALLLAGTAPVFSALVRRNNAMEVRSAAIGAAQQHLDRLRQQDASSFPTSGVGPLELINVDGKQFSVLTTYCANPAFCPTANTRHISVLVSYQNEEVFSVETVYTKLR